MKPNSKAKPKKRALETAIVTTTTMVNEKQISKTCGLVHSQYDEGLVYYQIEDDKELNFVLHGVSCGLCSIAFGVIPKSLLHLTLRNFRHDCSTLKHPHMQ